MYSRVHTLSPENLYKGSPWEIMASIGNYNF